MRIAALIVALAGCVLDRTDRPYPPVLGTPADVTTTAGPYPGYRVETSCPSTFVDVGVIGTGAITPPGDALTMLRDDLYLRVADIPSIWGWGVGLSCEPGVGVILDTDDWRLVDAIVERAGAFVRERDLALQVAISIGSIPAPL